MQDYVFRGLKDQKVGKMPGSIDGQQFNIEKCEGSSSFLPSSTLSLSLNPYSSSLIPSPR